MWTGGGGHPAGNPKQTCTLCVQGFPAEGVTQRDLKNMCRFMAGAEGCHVSFQANSSAPSKLFVKFDSLDHARRAKETLDGALFDPDHNPNQVLKAEHARREMQVRDDKPPREGNRDVHQASITPNQEVPSRQQASRTGTSGGALVTLAVLGIRESGVDAGQLEAWFRKRPGFVALNFNERIGGMFVKFDHLHTAEMNLDEANKAGIPAEWAHRNLDDEGGGNSSHGHGTHGNGSGSFHQLEVSVPPAPLPSRSDAPRASGATHHPGRSAEQIVTICVRQVAQQEGTVDESRDFFQALPGFDRMSFNERTGTLFVRFESAADAETAICQATDLGYNTEWAFRNLDDVGGVATRRPSIEAPVSAPPQPWPTPPRPVAQPPTAAPACGAASEPSRKRPRQSGEEINTLAVMHLHEQHMTAESIQRWFERRSGFELLQVNDRIGGMFIRFSSPGQAQQSLFAATKSNIIVEMARRNLEH